MNPLPVYLAVLVVLTLGLGSAPLPEQENCQQPPDLLVQQREMAAEVNLARADPRAYAEIIEQHFIGLGDDRLHRRGSVLIQMREGRPAVDEAVAYLRSAEPRPPLVLNSCLSQSAQDHVAESGPLGRVDHRSVDGRGPSERAAARVGRQVSCGENISYGRNSPREAVIALLVDDGVESRGHRRNLFHQPYKSLGIGVGSHSVYRTMTVHVMCTDELPAD